jgi:hypothetical protein
MATRNERRGQNQRRFQAANKRLHDAVEERVSDTTPVPFLCECADEECMGAVQISSSEWETIAERERRFVVMAGHPRIEGEDVIDTLGPYEIVEKPEKLT